MQLPTSWASPILLFLSTLTPADGLSINPTAGIGKVGDAKLVCPLESLKYNATTSGVEKKLIEVARSSSAASDVFNWQCPRNLDQYSRHNDFTPVEHYLALCKLGIQFPPSRRSGEELHKWHRFVLERGPHPSCQTIKTEVEGMTRDQANVFFCQGKSQAASDVLSGEADYAESIDLNQSLCNHWYQCKSRYPKYLKKGSA